MSDERGQYNRLKINIVLISMILGTCATMRMSDKKSVPDASDSTKHRYFDVPSRNPFSKFDYGQMA